jgi:hypothetical protein
VKSHQRAQGCFRLGRVVYGDEQIPDICSFVTLIRAALNAAKDAEADGTPPIVKKEIPLGVGPGRQRES